MLTGKLPFNVNAESDFMVMKEIIEGELEDPRVYYPHIDESTINLLMHMIDKNKESRLSSLDDVLAFRVKESQVLNAPIVQNDSDNSLFGENETIVNTKMFKNPFSFKGRIRRTEYGLSLIIFYVLYILVASMVQGSGSGKEIFIVFYIPLFWFLWTQGTKRCHDRNNSGLFQIIPYYVFWLVFAEGDIGENEYGPSPKGNIEKITINKLENNYCPSCNKIVEHSDSEVCNECGTVLTSID